MPKGGQNLQKCRQTCFPIQVGTRFICAEESAAPKSHKAQILLGYSLRRMNWLDWNMECQCLPLNFNNQNILKKKSPTVCPCFLLLGLVLETEHVRRFPQQPGQGHQSPKSGYHTDPGASLRDATLTADSQWLDPKLGDWVEFEFVMTCDVSISCKMCSKNTFIKGYYRTHIRKHCKHYIKYFWFRRGP